MTTQLERPIRREIWIDQKPYTLTITAQGFTLVEKRRRKGTDMRWRDVIGARDGAGMRDAAGSRDGAGDRDGGSRGIQGSPTGGSSPIPQAPSPSVGAGQASASA